MKWLIKTSPNVKRYKKLAQLQMQVKDWKGAILTIKKALKTAKSSAASLQLLRGIAETNLKQYDSAKATFQLAQNDKKIEKSASNWLKYLEQINQGVIQS